jgi:MFS family permease
MAFIAAGVPGLVLAVVVRFVLPEPRCRVGFPGSGGKSEGFINSLLGLKRKRSFCLTVIGIALYSIFTYGVMVFIPSFMIRSLHTTLAEVSMPWGAAIAVANIVGALVGGWLADRLGKTDIRWYARLPAAACLVSLPLYGLALLTTHIVNFIAIEFVAELSLSIGVPVSFAAALAVSGSHRRALATTAMLCSMLLIGGTLGPLLSGALSDALRAAFALESLRYSLIAMCGFLLPAAVAFYCASRTIPGDAEA